MKINKVLIISLLAVFLGVGLSSCSLGGNEWENNDPSGSEATSADTHSSSPVEARDKASQREEAKKMLDTFIEDVRKETDPEYRERLRTSGVEYTFTNTYPNTLRHFTDELSFEDKRRIIETYNIVFMMDENAKMEINASDIVIDGSSARIGGEKFQITINDNKISQKDSKGAGYLELTWSNDGWKISQMVEAE